MDRSSSEIETLLLDLAGFCLIEMGQLDNPQVLKALRLIRRQTDGLQPALAGFTSSVSPRRDA